MKIEPGAVQQGLAFLLRDHAKMMEELKLLEKTIQTIQAGLKEEADAQESKVAEAVKNATKKSRKKRGSKKA